MVDRTRFACLSRFYQGELPYIYAFVRHYLRLGFDRIYLIVQSTDLIAQAGEALADLSSGVVYIPVPEVANPDAVLNDCFAADILAQVREDYLLHVDCDEFLRLPYGWTIDHYIRSAGLPLSVVFQWVMVCADVDPASQLRRGFYGCNSKQMARTDCILGFETPHRFRLRSSVRDIKQMTPCHVVGSGADAVFLIHYWSRSFSDILIRCLHGGSHSGPRSSSYAQLTKHLADSTLPGRLKILACLMRHDRYYLVENLLGTFVDISREKALLTPWLTGCQQAQLMSLYVEYMQSLDINTHIAPFPVNRKINLSWLETLP